MKIALISEHASPLAVMGGVDAGGQNVHVAALACALAAAGHRVTVYTRRDAPQLARQVAFAPGVTVEHVDAGPPIALPKDALPVWMDAFAAYLSHAWRYDMPDVVHSHFWMSGNAALAAAVPLGIPVVHTYHALGIEKRRHQGAADSSPAQRVDDERAIARAVDRIIATASAEVFELVRMGAHPHAIKIVPCGVDLARFVPADSLDAPVSGRLRIVTLSRLVERKGVADVIAALASLPAAELIIAGGADATELHADPEARRLARLARALGVHERVTFRGRVGRADVPALLRSADVVACTPWYEPFGIVALEAMACGVPVVASAVGGLIDTVIDGVTGIHVQPRNPSGLAAALTSLAADPQLRRRLGRAGLHRAQLRYAWSRVAAETLDVYRGVIARNRRRAPLGEGVS